MPTTISWRDSYPHMITGNVLKLLTLHSPTARAISHVLNEQGTGYECLKSIVLKSESNYMKEYPRLIQIVKFEGDWRSQWWVFQNRSNKLSLQSILSSLKLQILKNVLCLCVIPNNTQIK